MTMRWNPWKTDVLHPGLLWLIALLMASLWSWSIHADPKRVRLDAAAGVTDPWSRYVALNHDWSPGAWCIAHDDDSEVEARWANAAMDALQDALRRGDARARAYLYSEEARWWCLSELRAQYPNLARAQNPRSASEPEVRR
jgi:hypothetical protein